MIADLIDDTLDIRLITRNVMSVYSTNDEYTDSFIRKLKHSSYIVNHEVVSSDTIISYVKKTYNIYENIFRFVKRHKDIDENKFIEYLAYFDKTHILWAHFFELDADTLNLVEVAIQLSTLKPIVIIDDISSKKYSNKIYSLLFHVGLEDRLIIYRSPYSNVKESLNNSTCQCYVKSPLHVKIESKFPNEFLNKEFNTDIVYYNRVRPKLYSPKSSIVKLESYTYSWYEIVFIILFSIKMLFIAFNNWRHSHVI